MSQYCEFNTQACPPPTLPPAPSPSPSPSETPAPEDCVWACIPTCANPTAAPTAALTTPPPTTAAPKCAEFKTFTQGGWGANCNGGNPGCYLVNNFATCFDAGIAVGCPAGFQLTWTNADAVNAFLPNGGPASNLTESATNPTSSPAGVFAAQLLAAKLNADFDRCDDKFAPCVEHVDELCFSDGPCQGYSVANVIDAADRVIGGCTCSAPAYSGLCSLSFADLSSCLDTFNNNFDNGNTNQGHLDYCTVTY